MLGDIQLQKLFEWLDTPCPFKFIVSSVPFTINWSIRADDTWSYFLKERNSVLDYIESRHLKHVYVLSGDRHEVAATRLNNGSVIEFSTSPIQQFYSPIDTYKNTGKDVKLFTWRVGYIKWATVSVEKGVLEYLLYVNDVQDAPVYKFKIDGDKVLFNGKI